MRKILFIFIIIISFNVYSLQKSGIEEYDNLDLTSGEVFLYLDKKFNTTDNIDDIYFYCKKYGGENRIYTLVIFYNQTDSPFAFSQVTDIENLLPKIRRNYVWYYADGNLKFVSKANDNISGRTVSEYENGEITSITNYKYDIKDGLEEKFLNGKKISSIEYKNNKKNGKTLYYNKDESIAVEEFYENDKFIKSKNIN